MAQLPSQLTASPIPAVTGSQDDRNVTAIGGGHGLSATLTALRRMGVRPTAVVSVADDGGSSGRLRRDLDVPPPGDLRRALSTLAADPLRRDLLEYRFASGELEGHALGNLILLGAAGLRDGDMAAGLEALGEVFRVRGRVVPACSTAVVLEAELADGQVVVGQRLITATPAIRRVRLQPADVAANPAAVSAIVTADLVVIGPGSLYTSLIPPLLVAGLRDALMATAAQVVVVANLRQQPGETEDLDLSGHLDALFAHLPNGLDIDILVANDGPVAEPARPLVAIDHHPRIGRIVTAPLADRRGDHDPERLAEVLASLA